MPRLSCGSKLSFSFASIFGPALLACVGMGVTAQAADSTDGKNFTQAPEVAAVQARGEAAVEPAPQAPATPAKPVVGGPTPQWIWGAEANSRYVLRTEFEGTAKSARLQASCDNLMTVWLNGQKIGSGDEWQSPLQADVAKHLQPGKNVIQAEVANQGGPSGFVLKLALTQPDGKTQFVVTDKTWQAGDKKDGTSWNPVKIVAKLGDQPWGDVFSGVPAGATATRGVFQVPPGFQVERLFTVPKDQLGSWVAIAFDNKGRLIASDQENKGLCRITPPKLGSSEPTKVERLDVKISSAQGLLYAFDSLYVSVNGGPGSGFYRLRDTNGDDQYDEVKKLAPFRGGGEHGPHALRLSPDGKSIFVICGNHTDPPAKIDASRLPTNWSEDHILPRQWDANGHAVGRLAPGGWIARTDPEGATWEIFSIGYRNPYDMAFNADGELFAYDADMEWDMGMPWYRPTRVSHATSGSEFGWRSGTGKWPSSYIDSLPQLVDIGPGSPVGVEFGYGTKFPAKYQKALYLCDWTFGTMYAIHIEPSGSSYKAVKEEFVSRTPLPLTDAAVGPDGALYFTVGGRGTQSELFRVTYQGTESVAPVDGKDLPGAELRALRHKIEELHRAGADPVTAVPFLWPHLAHADRHIRYAARVALEHIDPKQWQDRLFAEQNPLSSVHGAVALARQGDKALQEKLVATLERVDFAKLDEPAQLGLLRAWQLVFIRMGEPDKDTAARLARKFDGFFPAASDDVNRELCNLLVYWKSTTIAAKTIAQLKIEREPTPQQMAELLARNPGYGGSIRQMLANLPDAQKLHYLFALRNLRDGWTVADRMFYYQALQDARKKSGGASYQGFLRNIEKDAWENTPDVQQVAVEAAGIRQPFKLAELPKPQGPGADWTLDKLVPLSSTKLTGRDFKNGQKMFAAARCVICHRFAGDGGATGPDLTQLAGRFNFKDLCESIVDPSKVVSDQYRGTVITTTGGKAHSGRVILEDETSVTLLTDPEDSTKTVKVAKSEIDDRKPNVVSLMPKDLLKSLNENEVLDLLAYLLARGNPKDMMFR